MQAAPARRVAVPRGYSQVARQEHRRLLRCRRRAFEAARKIEAAALGDNGANATAAEAEHGAHFGEFAILWLYGDQSIRRDG